MLINWKTTRQLVSFSPKEAQSRVETVDKLDAKVVKYAKIPPPL